MAKTVRIFNYREIKNEDYVSHRGFADDSLLADILQDHKS